MAHRVTCPKCFSQLQVPPDFQEREFSCPRCLSRISTTPDVSMSVPVIELGALQLDGSNCPWCAERLPAPKLHFCPHCAAELAQGPTARPAPLVEREARRDQQVALICIMVLALLLGVGGVASVDIGGGNLLGSSLDRSTLLFIGTIVLLALVAGTMALLTGARRPR